MSHRLNAAVVAMIFLLELPTVASARAWSIRQETRSASLEKTKAEVARLIQSPDDRDRAWAAFYVRENRLTEYVPALIGFLNELPTGARNERDIAFIGVLDALIQLNAGLPPELVLQLFKRYPQETIHYLAKSPAKNEGLLMLLIEETSSTTNWFAMVRLLVDMKSKSVAAVLLKRLHFNVGVGVSNDGRSKPCVEHSYSMCGTGFFAVPDGYPPTNLYQLTLLDPESNNREDYFVSYSYLLVQPGRENAKATGDSDSGERRERLQMECLAKLLDTTVAGLNLDLHRSYSLPWKGAQAYQKDIERIKSSVRADFNKVVARLSERGLISSLLSEAVIPQIDFKVCDKRQDKRVSLPPIEDEK